MDDLLKRKMDDLRKRIRKLDSAVVAFSGGVDSTFLMRICREELGEKAVAVTVLADHYPASELSLARRIAKVIGVKHVTCGPSAASGRSTERLCSGKMFSSLKSLAARKRLKNVLDGSHRDDASDGGFSFIAARQAGIRSPLLESDLSKAEIRLLAKELGLPNWDKPSSSSGKKDNRSASRLKGLEEAKRYLASLGLKNAIVMKTGRQLAIVADKKDVVKIAKRMEAIRRKMSSLGFFEFSLMLG